MANYSGCFALKWVAQDTEGWRQRKDVKKLLYSMAENTTDDSDDNPNKTEQIHVNLYFNTHTKYYYVNFDH